MIAQPQYATHSAQAPQRRPARVVGCGRWNRGDDQFGLLVAQRLMQDSSRDYDVAISESPGADLLTLIEGVELLVLIDAAVASEALPVGALRRVRVCGQPTTTEARIRAETRAVSAHSLGVGYALALAESLGVRPREVWIYVVGIDDFEFSTALTPLVAAQIEPAARRIRKDLRRAVYRDSPGIQARATTAGAGYA